MSKRCCCTGNASAYWPPTWPTPTRRTTRARDIDFSAVLAGTEGTQLPLRATQAAHITFNDGESPAADLKYRNPYQASLDGNTVEMPVEQAAFSENNVRYQASLAFINLRIAQLQLAIVGQ